MGLGSNPSIEAKQITMKTAMQEFLMKDNDGIFYELKENAMKTTLQEIIDDIKVELETNIIAYHEISITKWVLRILESKLEKEKEQIIKAFSDGQETPLNHPTLPHYSRDEYYNDNYNQNK
jgi:hypothetical protein